MVAWGHHNVKRVKEVAEVRRLYVDGNSEAAIEMRRKLARIDAQYGQEACFASVPDRSKADAVLSVSQSSSMSGLDALIGQSGMSVSGQLDIRGKETLYYSEHGEPGLASDGAAAGSKKVLQKVFMEAGCSKEGERQ